MTHVDGQVDPQVLRVDLAVDVSALFTTRGGGASRPPYDGANLGLGVADDPGAVLANRAGVARVLGAPITWARAVHGRDVARVGEGGVLPAATPGDGGTPDVDALVTTERGRGVAALAADCVPVLLAATLAPDAGADAPAGPTLAVAAVHSGRRGLAAGVVPAAVAALGRAAHEALGRGAEASDVVLRAVVGPAICGRCYEVPQELRDEVAAVVPEAAATTSWGTPSLDLPAGVLAQLQAAGVDVRVLPVCTHEDPRFFSHRRDGVTGRFAGAIATRRTR
ncbi:polyphenol oxidase family protein [Serinibacter arcticus]|uniref:Purine nucleoside phosphorylase n=1 Tax=Serinibacter arcticus TaxID=1655435 RepID=A0A4Z1E1U7_9MICO|nr:polyphenol oxidase family protein [Serinibacter arcticus]TGO05856.1 hypothetical protein SERN_0048 [Serinibacter arcticus]